MSATSAQLGFVEVSRPIRTMTVEERRAYNRLVKQRSRAKAAQKTRSGALPTTKEAATALIAIAAARLALDDGATLTPRLARSVASLVGAPCDTEFVEHVDALLRRLAAPRRRSTEQA